MKYIISAILLSGLLVSSATQAMERKLEESDELPRNRQATMPVQINTSVRICLEEAKTIDLAWANSGSDDYIRIPYVWAKLSVTIVNLLEDIGEHSCQLPRIVISVSKEMFNLVIESMKAIYSYQYVCNYMDQVNCQINPVLRKQLSSKELTMEDRYELLLAADYLDIKDLLKACLLYWNDYFYGPQCMAILQERRFIFPNGIEENIKLAGKQYLKSAMIMHSNHFLAKFQKPNEGFDNVYFSPNSEFFLSGNKGIHGNVTIWQKDSDSYKPTVTLSGCKIFPGCFSSDSSKIIVHSNDGITIFNVANESREELYNFAKAQFSPDGAVFAQKSSTNGDLHKGKIVDGSFKFIQIFPANSDFTDNILSPDATKLLRINCEKGECTLNYFSEDDSVAKIASILLTHKGKIEEACFSPDSSIVACCTKQHIHLWDTQNPPIKIANLDILDGAQDGHDKGASQLCFSPDGKTLALLRSGHISFWHREAQWAPKVNARIYDGVNITSMCFSPDGKMIAATLGSNTIKIWHSDITKKLSISLRQSMLLNLVINASIKDNVLELTKVGNEELLAIALGLPDEIYQQLSHMNLFYAKSVIKRIQELSK